MFRKITIGFFLVAVAVGAVGFWSFQRNAFATDKVTLEILAPSEATLGEEIIYTVKYKNNSTARLEEVSLIFEYPQGTISSRDKKLRVTEQIEDINPGQELSIRFPARLFGKEGDVKEAKAFLSYIPKNLSRPFRSQTTVSTRISLVPLTFELDLPSRIESSQEIEFDLNYFSNSEYPLSDLRVRIEYPEGFEFHSASPSPIGESEWKISVLNKAEGGRITVRGIIVGNVQESKLFRAIIGRWIDGEFTLLKEVVRGAELTSPSLRISQRINGLEGSTASLGDILHYEILFKNIGDRSLENLFLLITLEGDMYDLSSVKVSSGKFQQGDNSIVWETRSVSQLRFLGKGEEGKVEFWVNVKEDFSIVSPQQKNLSLKSNVLVSDAKNVFETKLNSQLVLGQAGFFQDEVFGNQGPIPPRVGSKTTYTIMWQAQNLGNDVENVKARAVLGQGVKPTGRIFPEGAPITFDSQSREMVWEVGTMESGKGIFDSPASVAFQVEFTPEAFQRNSAAGIIGEATISGNDLFTQQIVASSTQSIDTTLPDDESVSESQGRVQ